MPLYETVFIARDDVTQQQVEAIAELVAGVVTEAGGEVKKREYWGLRGLAYRINKNRKGHYMLLGIDAPPAAIKEVERQLGLNEDVLREMTLRIETIDDTAYRSAENERYLAGIGRVSRIHRRKPRGRSMPRHHARANAAKSAVHAHVEHPFAHQKGIMGLVIRTIGLARASAAVTLTNMAYNMKRWCWLDRRAVPA